MSSVVAFALLLYGMVLFPASAGQGGRPPVALPLEQQNPAPTYPPGAGPPPEPIILHPERPPGSSRFPDEPQAPDDSKRQKPAFDTAKARREAQELSELADKIPGEIDQVSKSVLPKDLDNQLKRIQQLAKQLRSEISR